MHFNFFQYRYYSLKFFLVRSHFISRLSMIVWVNVVLNRTVSTTCVVVIFRAQVSCITSVDGSVIVTLLNSSTMEYQILAKSTEEG